MKKLTAFLLTLLIVGMTGIQILPASAEDAYTLKNDRLTLTFDPESGLSTVLDGKTGKTWEQFYAIPPKGEASYTCDFTDSGRWNLGTAKLDGTSIRVAAAPGKQEIKMNFPAPGIMPATYLLKVSYKAEAAKDVSLKGIVHFEQDGYTPRGHKAFELANFAEETTTDGWQTVEIAIPLSEFPSYTNCFLLYFEVVGGANAGGTVIIGESIFYGGAAEESYPIVTDVKQENGTISYKINNVERENAQLPPVTVSMYLTKDRSDEVTVKMDGAEEEYWYQNMNIPATFVSSDESLRWVLPKDAGLYLPAYDLDNHTNRNYTGGDVYVHMGLNMAMFGAIHPETGDGYYALIDEPVLTTFKYMTCGVGDGKTAYVPQLVQIGTNDCWEKDRTVRFRFQSEGGYVGMAQDYRKIAEEKGFAVTLKEKGEKNPNVLKTAGAHRIDLAIDVTQVGVFMDKLREAGVTDVMIKLSGLRNNTKYIQRNDLVDLGLIKMMTEEYPEFHMYEYEAYRDLFIGQGEFVWDPGYVELAKPYRVRTTSGFLRGWVDITGLQSYVVCSEFGPTFLDWTFNTQYPLSKIPVYSRMYDVLATTSFKEGVCYDEEHPGTRLTTYENRLAFFKSSMEEYGMDNHTEGAAEYIIPYANSGEGPLDIMGNIDTAGLNSMMTPACDRIPFWELVYHDCFGLYYHWEHGLTSNPYMEKENLYCVLYGERGMFEPVYWDNLWVEGGTVDKYIEQMQRISTVTRRVALEKMTNHQFLTADGMVQKTTFSDGTEVVVNFSDKPYLYENGTVTIAQAGEDDGITVVTGAAEANGRVIYPEKELVIIPVATGEVMWIWIVVIAVAAVGVAALILILLAKKAGKKETVTAEE